MREITFEIDGDHVFPRNEDIKGFSKISRVGFENVMEKYITISAFGIGMKTYDAWVMVSICLIVGFEMGHQISVTRCQMRFDEFFLTPLGLLRVESYYIFFCKIVENKHLFLIMQIVYLLINKNT